MRAQPAKRATAARTTTTSVLLLPVTGSPPVGAGGPGAGRRGDRRGRDRHGCRRRGGRCRRPTPSRWWWSTWWWSTDVVVGGRRGGRGGGGRGSSWWWWSSAAAGIRRCRCAGVERLCLGEDQVLRVGDVDDVAVVEVDVAARHGGRGLRGQRGGPDLRPAEPDLGPTGDGGAIGDQRVPRGVAVHRRAGVGGDRRAARVAGDDAYGPMSDPTVPVVVAGGTICRLGGVGAGAGVCTRTALTIAVTRRRSSGSVVART